MTKSAISSESLRNPAEKKIASSEWLLLEVVRDSREQGASTDEIRQKLHEKLKEIRKKHHDFSIMWSSGYDLEKMLDYFSYFGLAAVEVKWKITKEGEKFLENKREPIGKVIGS